MKKVIYIVGMIALIAAMMVMPAAATTWTVCSAGCDFTGIDAASEKNPALADGDTVFVYNGSYSDTGSPVTMWKSITLKGEGADVVTYDMGGYCLLLHSTGTVVEGFKIVNSDVGVEVKAPDCIIRNCVFEGLSGRWGIQLGVGGNTTFMNNVILDSTTKYGTLNLGVSCIVINNTIINSKGPGIMLYRSMKVDNVITRNNIISCGKGIWLYKAGSGNKIYLNNFVDNTKSVVISRTTTTQFWNSTEPIEYVCPTDGTIHTDYLGNYWSDHPGGMEDGCGIWDAPYDIPGSSYKDYRPLMAGFENYPEPLIDLVPAAITAPALFAGEPNTITATIANIGALDAGSFKVSLSANGTVVDTANVASLGIGNVTNVSFQWTPASVGEIELCVVADPDNEIEEMSEANNDKCIDVMVNAPDLTPTAITTAELLLLNQSSVVNASIANIGTADARSFNVSLSADGNVVDTASVESLGIGNVTNVSFEWTPASVGEIELCVAADSDGTVTELSETNNETCIGVTVYAPELVPTAMTPNVFFPGKPNAITARIENIGDADAGSFNVTLSVDGTEVDTASVASVGISDSTEVSFSWTATVGDHELCVLADSDSEVDESDEANNELCKDVTVYPNTVYLVPKDSGAPYCCEAEVEMWVEAEDGFQGGQINLTYSLDCANVTGVEFNPVWDFESATWWDTYEGYTRISFAKSEGMVSGDVWIGNLMIHCTSEDIDTLCSTTLGYAMTTKLVTDFGTEIEANLIEGTFGCDIPAEEIKGKAISDLGAISTTNKHSQKDIDEAIKHVSKSLVDSLWTGAARLDTKQGHKVFDEEKKAVMHLKKITEERGEHADTAIVKGEVEAVIAKLTEEADEQLAVVAINDAKSTPVQDAKKQDKVDTEIAKAEEELDKAEDKLNEGKPDRAIDHFKLAWEHAQLAIKHAEG